MLHHRICSLLLFTFLAWGGTALMAAEPPKQVVTIPATELSTVKKNIADGKAVLVDVRSVNERQENNLQGTIHLPLAEIKKHATSPDELKEYLAKHLPKDKVIYVHCQAGVRAKQACVLCIESGLNLQSLNADYDELLEAGFMNVKPKK
jgi:phage shock protein E